MAVPSPAPDGDTVSPVAAPLGPVTCEMPARIKLFTQSHKAGQQLIWESYLRLANAQQGILPFFAWLQLEKGAPYG